MTVRRRGVLATVGAAVASTAGCIGPGSPRSDGFELEAFELPENSPTTAYLDTEPTTVRASLTLDYSTAYKRSVLDDLFEAGTATVADWPLAPTLPFGNERRQRPAFLERDGAYHRVTVSSERVVERDRRLFYVDLLDGGPDGDGQVASPPFPSLDERDATVLSAALDAVYADRGSPLDNGELDDPNAVTYHEDLDAGESALVPSPPFEYVQYEDRYYEAVAERASVPVTERTFAVETVASTREGLREHVLSTLPATRFSRVSLSGDARAVLDDAVDDEYTEPPPASTALTDVLSPLGIADALDPYDQYEDEARFGGVLARYDGTWYELDLTVIP